LRRSVDPLRLYNKFAAAFGLPAETDPLRIVSQEFPDINDELFRERYLLREVLRKFPSWELGIDPTSVALEGLDADETANRKTNDRLVNPTRASARVRRILHSAACKAVEILGPFDWSLFEEGLRFGPKATAEHSGESLLVKKLTERKHVTSAAFNLAVAVLQSRPFWAFELDSCLDWTQVLRIQDFDRVCVVPKNAQTGRAILIQPGFAVMLQLAVGYCIRTRLLQAGMVLNDQRINQELARISSIDGRDATVDLRSASNSLTSGLVWLMIGDHPNLGNKRKFDPTWYRLMDATRTTHGSVGGSLREWEMFSAMGNGYTFELESLIFRCVAAAVCHELGLPERVSVYGDDIIIPVEAVSLFRRVMSYAGFRLNMAKSFWGQGQKRFRESCGKHYLNGRDVSPFYVDTPLDTVSSVILLMNNIKRWAHNGTWGLDGRLKGVWEWLYDHLPGKARDTFIPLGEDNDGLIRDWDECSPRVHVDGLKARKWTALEPHWVWAESVLEIRKEYTTQVVDLAPLKTPYVLGFRALTWNVSNRGRQPEQEMSYLIWHYLHSFRKVELEKPEIKGLSIAPNVWPRFVRGHAGRAVCAVDSPYTPYREPGEKLDVRMKTREVSTWTDTGPWFVLPRRK
jgi:hypothetical protein